MKSQEKVKRDSLGPELREGKGKRAEETRRKASWPEGPSVPAEALLPDVVRTAVVWWDRMSKFICLPVPYCCPALCHTNDTPLWTIVRVRNGRSWRLGLSFATGPAFSSWALSLMERLSRGL